MILANLSAFTNDAAGLEKCLRFLQAICIIALGVVRPDHWQVEKWNRAKGHFALGVLPSTTCPQLYIMFFEQTRTDLPCCSQVAATSAF
jgi:hypothetical protein